MKRRLLTLLAPVFLVACADAIAAKQINRHFHESFEDIKPGTRLDLEHGDGDVTITPWDKDVVDIEVRYRVSVTRIGLGSDPVFDVEFRRSGDTIYVVDKERGGMTIGFHSSREYEYIYEIRAPEYVELRLEGDDGNVRIEGWQGAIDSRLGDGDVYFHEIQSGRTSLRLGDGDLHVDGLEGELDVRIGDGNVSLSDCATERGTLHLADGDVTLDECEGNFEISIADGHVRLEDHRAGTLRIRGEDGNVEAGLLKAERRVDLDIEVEDGNVTVDLEHGISAAFSAQTDDGRIDLDLPEVSGLEEGKRQVSGEIHGGEGQIRVRTEDGNITLRQSGLRPR